MENDLNKDINFLPIYMKTLDWHIHYHRCLLSTLRVRKYYIDASLCGKKMKELQVDYLEQNILDKAECPKKLWQIVILCQKI